MSRPQVPTAIASRHYALRGGPPPLDVMMGNMWFYHSHSEVFFTRVVEALEDRGATPEQILKAMDKFLFARDKSQECAKDAAPYVHPKLGAKVEIRQDPGQLEDTELLEALATIREQLEPELESESVG